MTETQFKKKVQQFLTDIGAWHVKFMGNGFTKVGVPDILACVAGKFLAIELKTDTGRVTPIQEHQLQEIRKAGGYGMILRPMDFAAFQEGVIHWIRLVTAESSSGTNAATPTS
jgi:hypothetical protein